MSKVINYASFEEGVELHRADTIDSVASNWHIKGWLPEGELVILGGDGGAGKTLIAMDWVATLSNSDTDLGIFPDGSPAQRGSALIWSCEDDWERVLKPRLDAAGANGRNIFFVGNTIEFNSRREFDFKRDLPGLIKKIERFGDVRILVIDTVMDAVSGGGNNAKKVRQDLLKLVDIAHRYQITVIGIAHLVKGAKKGDPVKSLAGSQAFGNLARHVLIAMKVNLPGQDESAPSVGVLTRAKSNIGKLGGGRIYEIHPASVEHSDGSIIDTSKLIWHSKVLSASAADICRWAESEKSDLAASPRNRAQEFLLRLLEAGPISANKAYDLAEEEGITPKMLRGAFEKLRALSTRKRDEGRTWNEWSLPESRRDYSPLINLDHLDGGHSGNAGQVGQVGRARKAYETEERNSVAEWFSDFMRPGAPFST